MLFSSRSSRKASARSSKIKGDRRRKLFFESLEDRRVLALTLGTWSTVAPMPTPRSQTAVAVDPNTHLIYSAGGYSFGGANERNTFEVYNPTSNTWATGPSLPVATRGAPAAFANGNIYVFGATCCGAVQRCNV